MLGPDMWGSRPLAEFILASKPWTRECRPEYPGGTDPTGESHADLLIMPMDSAWNASKNDFPPRRTT